MAAAAITMGECRKLYHTSPPRGTRGTRSAAHMASSPAERRRTAAQAQAGIDGEVEEVHDEVDDHERERHEHEVGGHEWDIHEPHRLQEEQPHPRPLEH